MVKYRKKTSDWSVQQREESQRAVSSKIDRVDRSRTTSPLPVRATAIRRRTISANQTISSARRARGKTMSAKETISYRAARCRSISAKQTIFQRAKVSCPSKTISVDASGGGWQ
jgi:hypothetical protein